MTKARRFGPNGDPGSRPSGGRALKRLLQHGQTPPCSVTRVTSGLISGISTRWQDARIPCTTPETSKPQPWQKKADTIRSEVGLGWSGRCAPACGVALALGVGVEASDAF